MLYEVITCTKVAVNTGVFVTCVITSYSIHYTKLYEIQIKNNSTILVAEDIEVNFKLIEQILSVYNVELIWARNGEEAVEICKLDKEIDLLLMDIKMPVLDGYSAAKQIKQIRNNLPIRNNFV